MKRILNNLFALMAILAFAANVNGQCINTSQFGGATVASGCPGAPPTTLSTCNFGGEFAPANGLVPGNTYRFTSGPTATFITITTTANVVIQFGTSPIDVVIPAGVTSVRVHVNTSANPTCGTNSLCNTTTAQCLNCTAVGGPANDNCSGAIAISSSILTGGTTTNTGTTVNSCVDNVATCGTTLNTAGGVWYTFTTAACAGALEFNTCTGTGYDSKIGVFTGSCTGLVCVGGNDDACGLQSRVSVSATPNTTYYVLVTGFSTATGAFTLTTTFGVDPCCLADPLTITVDPSEYIICPGDTAFPNIVVEGGIPLAPATIYAVNSFIESMVTADFVNGAETGVLGAFPSPISGFLQGGMVANGLFYVADGAQLKAYNLATNTITNIGSNTLPTNNNGVTGMDYNKTTGIAYVMTAGNFAPGTGQLFTVDLNTGATTLVGSLTGSNAGQLGIWFVIDPTTNIGYIMDLVTNEMYSCNVATGATAFVGNIGFDSNFGQDAFFYNGTIYGHVFNGGTFTMQYRSFNINTGASTLIADLGFNQYGCYDFVSNNALYAVTYDNTTGLSCTDGSVTCLDPAIVLAPGQTEEYEVCATDACGVTVCATFTVSFYDIPEALVCNDDLNISLDGECEMQFRADMFLEGPYEPCYDNYELYVWPFNSEANEIGDLNNVTIPVIGLLGSHTYRIVDPRTGNTCWGYFTFEDKIGPVVDCGDPQSFRCNDLDIVLAETVGMLYNLPGQSANRSELSVPPTFVDGCSGVTPSFTDAVTSETCEATTVIRSWVFTDASGNKTRCEQVFTFDLYTVFDVVLPPSLIVTNCGVGTSPEDIAAFFDVDSRTGSGTGSYNDDYTQTPNVVELHEGYAIAYPHYFEVGYDGALHPQKIDNNVCNIFSKYTDIDFPACGLGCGGNSKIIRTWTLLDWCNLQAVEFLQLIKAVDLKAPTFIVKDVTVSVNPWGCVANFDIPMPWELQDNCDPHPFWSVQGPSGVTITGNPTTGYRATGAPKGVHAFVYKAWDCCGNESFATAFVTVIDRSAPVAVAKQNIVISLTGSGTGGDGAAKLYAWHVDNGSYDHCSDIRLEIRRPEGAPACENLGIGDHNNNVTFDDDDTASPNVSWAHPNDDRDDTDNGEYVKFCCEDLAGGTSVVHQAILRVWDDGNMNGITGDNLIISGMLDNYNETWADIRVEDKLPPTLVCPPDVTITCDMDLNLSEGVWTGVDSVDLTMTGGPAVAYALCSGNPVEYRDVPTWTNTCKNVGRIRREFRSVKGNATVNCYQFITVAALPSVFTVTPPTSSVVDTDCDFTAADIRDSEKPRVLSGPCDVIGENIEIDTFFFEDGVCKKWRVTYEYVNWCTGEIKAGGVKWYKYKDDEKPVVTCGDQMFPANPNPQNPNGVCEGTVTLTASATDAGGCTDNGWLKWLVFVDLWGNGSIDLEYSSFLPTTDNNLNNDTNGNGIPDRYVAPTSSGGTVTIPAFVLDAELSTHKVTWKVTDGCGNFSQCSSTFMVVDKKAPTPYCVSLSSAVMENGEVELWAIDFDKGSFDNCTPQSGLLFTFNGEMPVWAKINVEHYFKGLGQDATAAEYAAGNAQKWVPTARSSGRIFNCDDVENSPVDVQMTVWDQNGNSDYCSVTLTLVDNQGACGGSKISGKLVNHDQEEISNVIVTIDPSVGENKVRTVSGTYAIDGNQNGIDHVVTPTKADDYKNGVNTLDLVHIQRHILGTAKLNTPEKLIAGDVNADAKITSTDLVELRKLILGLTTKLNNNDSWAFVPKSYVYPDVNNPYNAPRSIAVYNLQGDVDGKDFTGIKIGDVDQTASASLTNIASTNRSAKSLRLSAEDKNVVNGDVVTIDVTANNFKDVFGYQFTANLAGMELVEVKSGAIAIDETNYGIPVAGKMTMSWSNENGSTVTDGEVLFTLVMRATTTNKVSNMIALNSDVTSAESYGADMSANGIELSFRNGETTNAEYALYQNEPNPFKATTTVSFNMVKAGQAEFTLTDVTGKVVYTRTVDAVKGMNTVEFNRNDVATSGIVYYTVKSGEFTATKAMIVIE